MLIGALDTGLFNEPNIVVLLWKLCTEFLKSLKSVVFNLKTSAPKAPVSIFPSISVLPKGMCSTFHMAYWYF